MNVETVLGVICVVWLAALFTKIVLDVREIRKLNRSLYGKKK